MTLDTDDKLRQDLMLGLIYPAVLGSIFYTVLGELWHQIEYLLDAVGWQVGLAGSIKLVLALIALAFYFCDYLYISFTNLYSKKFFWYDLLFVFAMYGAFSSVRLGRNDLPPAVTLMMLLYLVFMLLYLEWDWSEFKSAEDTEEADLYRQVVWWEVLSIVAILASLPIIWYLEFRWQGRLSDNGCTSGLVSAVVMGAVTLRFGFLAGKKRKFSKRYPIAGPEGQAPNPTPQVNG